MTEKDWDRIKDIVNGWDKDTDKEDLPLKDIPENYVEDSNEKKESSSVDDKQENDNQVEKEIFEQKDKQDVDNNENSSLDNKSEKGTASPLPIINTIILVLILLLLLKDVVSF
jgi:hypothetical protein